MSCIPRDQDLRSMSELYRAALIGSAERTVAVLSRGGIDVDEGTPDGATLLMVASMNGFSRVVRILLNKGAKVAKVDDDGFSALHRSSQTGNLAVTKVLVKAGADLEAKTSAIGWTPLHLAVDKGHSGIMRVLIEAGANPNSRAWDGSTPMYYAVEDGQVDAVKVLFRAKANPLLGRFLLLPLDAAAGFGHLDFVDELIREHGIDGCGGPSGGVSALGRAAQQQHMEIMGMLTSAGVVDTGLALHHAACFGQKSSVKFLLQQQGWRVSGEGAAYLEILNIFGATPLVCSIQACCSCSPRITRLLVDAGADTTKAVRLPDEGSVVAFDGTPLALADLYLSDKKIKGEHATEGQLHSLEATRRLLMRVGSVHATSWLWACDMPSVTRAATEGAGKTMATSTPLILILPILRRRAGKPRVLLAALSRHSRKPY